MEKRDEYSQVMERLRQLGKGRGPLTYGDVADALGGGERPEGTDWAYLLDALEEQGISLLEDTSEAAEVGLNSAVAEEEEEEGVADDTDRLPLDGISADDPVRLYLREIGRVPLLSAADEVVSFKRGTSV